VCLCQTHVSAIALIVLVLSATNTTHADVSFVSQITKAKVWNSIKNASNGCCRPKWCSGNLRKLRWTKFEYIQKIKQFLRIVRFVIGIFEILERKKYQSRFALD
jgi:hypothetical protein